MIFFGCVPQLSHSKSPGGLVIGIGRDLYILYYPIYINLLGIMIASDHRMTNNSGRRSELPAQWSVEFVNQPGIIGSDDSESPGIMVNKGSHPQMAELFRLVKYDNLPRLNGNFPTSSHI